MKTIKASKPRNYQVARLVGAQTANELNVEILDNWDHMTLRSALGACELAKSLYGGSWVVIMETAKTVYVWVNRKTYNNFKAWEQRHSRNTAKVA